MVSLPRVPQTGHRTCAFRRRAKSCTSRTESAVSHSGQATSVASFSLSESATCLSMQEKQNRCEHASNE
eukprot:m.43777 g.43777  ORF g.43777 m.43777 type:complete len:69 (-) comp11659_c0_seq2:306-512(-)